MKHSSQISCEELFHYGGKALGLLWLKARDYSVPDFYLVSYLEVNEWLQKSGITQASDWSANSHRLRDHIQSFVNAQSETVWLNVAIRSSAQDEDGQQDSFAGVHESVLNVQNQDEAIEALMTVIKSAFSSTAQIYRQSRHLYDGFGMGIIIQKMLKPLYAGVSFAMNPQTGCCRSVWMSVTAGLADQLVAGRIQGDEYLFENNKVNKIDGASVLVREAVLRDIALLTLQISQQKGQPQDIEWAYDGEKIWFVQVRAITTPIIPTQLEATVFDNSNIQESYCGVTTPLTFTYAAMAYERVYRQLLRLMLMSDVEIDKAQWNLQNLIGLVNGRVYYNINNWYKGLLYMPSFGKRKEEMEDMMGLESSVDFIQGHQLTPLEKVKKLPQMLKLMMVMVYRFSRMNQLVEEFDDWFWKLYNDVNIEQVYQLNEWELFEKLRQTQTDFMEKWGIPVLNDTKVMMDMGAVKRLLAKYHFSGELKSILYGTDIESLTPTLEIHRLAQQFGAEPPLKKLLLERKSFELLKTLEIFYSPVFFKVKEFIHLYGDRCIGDLKLETITMRQDPEILFTLIRNFILSGLDQKKTLFPTHSTETLFADIMNQMSSLDRWRFQYQVQALKKSITAREKLRLHRTRSFGLSRVLYLALGEKWKQRKLFTDPRDIFYLTHEEIFNIGSGKMTTMSLSALIEVRKKDFLQFENQKVPTQVTMPFPPFIYSSSPSELENSSTISRWTGLAAAQGVCEGEVVFIRDSQNIPDLKDKVLLAERTDPGWTPLFTMVKGVIVEKGSMLSHSAIIAREMGIPSVIGVKNITQILKNGDRVRVDGNKGTIELLLYSTVSKPLTTEEANPLSQDLYDLTNLETTV